MTPLKLLPAVGVLMTVLSNGHGIAHASIKDEFQRAQACDYFNAEFLSDRGIFEDEKVRFCISDDQSELIFVMAMGTSWVVPFNREYRSEGTRKLYTVENGDLVLYQKENGVVKRNLLGRKR